MVWYCFWRKVEEECLFVLLYITRPRGITSTIGPRHVYNVMYKGAKNKKNDSFFFVCFKVLTVS